MRAAFLPHNYSRLMYQRLQDLRQRTRSVDEYTEEFDLLVMRNDLSETAEQLATRYIGGLREDIKDALNLMDLFTVADAHQRAVQVEKQLKRKSSGGSWGSSNQMPGAQGASSSRTPVAQVTAKPGAPQPNRQVIRCFRCNEPGHRVAECRQGRTLFAETEDPTEGQKEEADESEVLQEEEVVGDQGQLLMVRRICLAPRGAEGDAWVRSNIFMSTCTIGGKVCRFVIDSGSCENLISEEVVQKLGLKTEKHPHPYQLGWLKKGGEIKVTNRCLVSFSVGPTYKDQAWCDVVAMDACHLLLGRPWQYHRKVRHEGYNNTYSLMYGPTKITLLPSKEIVPKPKAGEGTNLLSRVQLQQIHETTRQKLTDSTAKYKTKAYKKRRFVEFAEGDFVLAILTKDRFSAGEYNKLAARKIGPVEIVEKINPNAYRLKLPSHIRTSDVFHVKHLVPFLGDSSSDDDSNSRSNSFQAGEDDAALIGLSYLEGFDRLGTKR